MLLWVLELERANYPCITLEVDSGRALAGISGVYEAIIAIDIYSDTNKKQLWTIYEYVRSLLDNQEQHVSDDTIAIHSIRESDVRDSDYELSSSVWHLSAEFRVVYGSAGLNITTAADGAVYASQEAVSAIPSMEIAKFSGKMSLEISFQNALHSGRELFGKTVHFYRGAAKLRFEKMTFRASILSTLWNVDADTSGKLSDGTTSATTYRVSQESHPLYLQVLFQMTKTDDGKRLEVEADRAICRDLQIPFSKSDFSVVDCTWLLLGSASGDVMRVAVEN